MNAKNLLVAFVAIASILLLASTISAAPLASSATVQVDDQNVAYVWSSSGSVNEANQVSVVAGETITVEVYFTAAVNASDVRIKAEIEGEKVDVEARTQTFDVESGKRYKEVLTLQVPYELKKDLSDTLDLNVQIWNKDYETNLDSIPLRVQRESYLAEVKSVSAPQQVSAGDNLAVDLVIKNRGYNDIDDVYVTVKIPALGLERSGYFGDLVSLENKSSDDDDEEDTVSGRLTLAIPYTAKAGTYTVEIVVENDDSVSTETTKVVIDNDFSGSSNVIVATNAKTVAAGEAAEYEVLIVNPTDRVKVYRVSTDASSGLSVSVSESAVAVPAGSSKAIRLTATSQNAGDYKFVASVSSGESLVATLPFTTSVEGTSVTANPVLILTIILAVIFVILLVVLIVLVSRKPQQKEDFGESYY